MKIPMSRVVVASLIIAVAALAIWKWRGSQGDGNEERPLRVAALLPLTGPAASTGEGAKRGLEIALEEIRRGGGSISLDLLDTQANPKTALSVYQQLMATAPPDVIISSMSGVTAALLPVLTGERLTVATVVADTSLSNPSPDKRLFRVFLGAEGMGTKAADYVLERGVRKTASVSINDDYGRACAQSFKKAYLSSPGTSVIEDVFGLMDKDFRNSWARILSEQPGAVFVAGYGPGYFAVLNSLREAGFGGLIVTDWSMTDPAYLEATNGVRDGAKVVAVQWSPRFESAYKERFGVEGSYVLSGYAHATLDLVWKAYSSSNGSIAEMASHFAKIKNAETAMGKITVLPSGGVSAEYAIFSIEGMKVVR